MKKCFKCGIEKELSCFYVHKQMADGHLNKCIECAKKDVMIYRDENIEKIREYDRQRGKSPKRLEIGRNRQRNMSPEQRRKRNESRKKWIIENQNKKAAQTILGNAVRDKRIQKPDICSRCGLKGKIHGHHEDYSFPLSVKWLCPLCHGKEHRQYT